MMIYKTEAEARANPEAEKVLFMVSLNGEKRFAWGRKTVGQSVALRVIQKSFGAKCINLDGRQGSSVIDAYRAENIALREELERLKKTLEEKP